MTTALALVFYSSVQYNGGHLAALSPRVGRQDIT